MLDRQQLDGWLYGAGPGRRNTQDPPVLPDVWFAFGLGDSDLLEPEVQLLRRSASSTTGHAAGRAQPSVDVLIRPPDGVSAGRLAHVLAVGLEGYEATRGEPREPRRSGLAHNDGYVVARVDFRQLVQVLLPLTGFWQLQLWPGRRHTLGEAVAGREDAIAQQFEQGQRKQGAVSRDETELPGNLVWLVGLVGRIAWELGRQDRRGLPTARQVTEAGLRLLGPLSLGKHESPPLIARVTRNRPVRTAVWRSRVSCKADAATRLFELSCTNVRWAVIDSGIDARHPAFARRRPGEPVDTTQMDDEQASQSRVAGTWDFTRIRRVLAYKALPASDTGFLTAPDPVHEAAASALRGSTIDWGSIAPQLAVAHDDSYRPPQLDHGTHVAGILAGDWRSEDTPSAGADDVVGICPDMSIYDLRVFNDDGYSDEFQILSAMQFVRHINCHAERPLMQGVNMSFSLHHEVDKYAAGATPVCDETHRLIGSGVVCVVAAGNAGRAGYIVDDRVVEGYRGMSITDPGNAEKAITVGATHRDQPHTYGISYFSSRGPTGDGRVKPDLVAPGEKVVSAVPDGGLRSKDGTSQAAPHVSGACALLMSRYPELMGQPERIKEILMSSCTDLGRERAFQGAGMLDILRALQAV